MYPNWPYGLGMTDEKAPASPFPGRRGPTIQWHVAQLPPAQPEQPPPEDDAAVRAPVCPAPVRVRQVDMSFWVRPEAHLGHGGQVVAELDTMSSNCAPQS